jgi:hypothetical protein
MSVIAATSADGQVAPDQTFSILIEFRECPGWEAETRVRLWEGRWAITTLASTPISSPHRINNPQEQDEDRQATNAQPTSLAKALSVFMNASSPPKPIPSQTNGANTIHARDMVK